MYSKHLSVPPSEYTFLHPGVDNSWHARLASVLLQASVTIGNASKTYTVNQLGQLLQDIGEESLVSNNADRQWCAGQATAAGPCLSGFAVVYCATCAVCGVLWTLNSNRAGEME